MDVKQIASIMNTVTSEVLGKEAVVHEDLSNIVDVGTEIFDSNSVDNYVKSLIDHIGRVVFVNRPYRGNVPSIMKDAWEYGSILEKITMDKLPEAVENESWDLTDGKTYDPNVFHKPQVSAKFFNKRVTFEIDMSITERQVKESFSSPEQLNAFLSMIYNAIDKSMTIKIDSLVMRTIDNLIASTLHTEFQGTSDYNTVSGVKAVNLLKLYNDKFGGELQAESALTNPDFVKFATLQLGLYIDRLGKISTLFNAGEKERFTPKDMLNVVMLSEFKQSANVYLQSSTFHNEYTALPNADTVPYWQGSGTDYGFNSTSAIDINIDNGDGTVSEVRASGILAVMFDRDACGVTNLNRRVTTQYNPKGEFFNNFYKFDAGYFNDLNENAVVFFVA